MVVAAHAVQAVKYAVTHLRAVLRLCVRFPFFCRNRVFLATPRLRARASIHSRVRVSIEQPPPPAHSLYTRTAPTACHMQHHKLCPQNDDVKISSLGRGIRDAPIPPDATLSVLTGESFASCFAAQRVQAAQDAVPSVCRSQARCSEALRARFSRMR